MVWFNLETSDVRAARDFYAEAVGWGVQEWGDCPRPYAMWTTHGVRTP
jgi:predicted enzyme related to lactoylglutathione lyase